MLTDEVAGDPMTDQKWIRSSLSRLSKRLKEEGHQASTTTVARLLKKMGFSLKANKRKQGRLGCPERDEQFKYIASQKERFITTGLPVISIDTKKTELIGEFMNKGRTWRRQAEEVNEHDFPGAAKCRAVPFGIYDIVRNEGHVYVGCRTIRRPLPFTPLRGGGRMTGIADIRMQARCSSWQIAEAVMGAGHGLGSSASNRSSATSSG